MVLKKFVFIKRSLLLFGVKNCKKVALKNLISKKRFLGLLGEKNIFSWTDHDEFQESILVESGSSTIKFGTIYVHTQTFFQFFFEKLAKKSHFFVN